MNLETLRLNILECSQLSYARSSGPGGQNVNKVSTACIIHIPVFELDALHAEEQMNVYNSLKNRINSRDELVFHCDETRSQNQNKERVIERACLFIMHALEKPKPRIDTRPSRSSKEKRLVQKKQKSQQKFLRSKNFGD